ncbi:hypothetical protein [Streptomyces sp. G45]|uniref:hypothetical protein n=1 Tax=Streptomyces sp. G45 TaxID=3406627 RepID=UPI003C19A2BB
MTVTVGPEHRHAQGTTRYRALSLRDVTEILKQRGVGPDVVDDVRAVGAVLPFRVNDHVLDNLIDWDDIPHDPMFQLLFPQPGMLDPAGLATMRRLSTAVLRRHVEPLLDPRLDRLEAIRIGTKSLTFWPARFCSDADAPDLLRLFEQVVAPGRSLVLVADLSHPRELQSAATRRAIRLARSTGANIYCQVPLVAHVNDRPETWERLWNAEVKLGCVPYYMFVERDTGPRRYFEVPLIRAHDILATAYRMSSGLARTVKGPVMSATPGKVVIDGYERQEGDHVTMQLCFVQSRNAAWVGRPFTAKTTTEATWFSHLQPSGTQPWWSEESAATRRPT